jgi:protein PhnA
MNMINKELIERANGNCELCQSNINLTEYRIKPEFKPLIEGSVLLCEKCLSCIENNDFSDSDHFRLLSDAIWSETSAVKILSYQILKNYSNLSWAQSLMDQIYLDDDDLNWVRENTNSKNSEDSKIINTKDSSGNILAEGDAVTLIKDLDVKGAGFTAKRGTLVKNIHLTDNPEHIEGKVNGMQIVLLTKFLKKA